MKTAIVYVSTHHGNTKKLLDAIGSAHGCTLINVLEDKTADISGYDRVGIASGIAYGKYYPQLLEYLKAHGPQNKPVFFIHTAGDPRESQNSAARAITDAAGCKALGTYFCKGFDTFGPFKLIGGIAKGHPDADDIEKADAFVGGLSE